MNQQPISAAGWRQKKKDQPATAPLITTMLTLPSGAVVEVCRPPLDTWVMTGKLPQAMVNAYLRSVREKEEQEGKAGADAEAPTAEKKPETEEERREIIESLLGVRDLVIAAVVRPRIVLRAINPDEEIEARDIPDPDFFFLYQWITRGAKELPIPTETGEVSAEALISFREQPTDGASPDPGAGGA